MNGEAQRARISSRRPDKFSGLLILDERILAAILIKMKRFLGSL